MYFSMEKALLYCCILVFHFYLAFSFEKLRKDVKMNCERHSFMIVLLVKLNFGPSPSAFAVVRSQPLLQRIDWQDPFPVIMKQHNIQHDIQI